MGKKVNKFTKILLLIVMIFSDLMAPIKVLADEITEVTPNKGDIGINNTISTDENGENSVTVSAGSLTNEGDVEVTKTVSHAKDENGNIIEGRYNIEFNIKGKDKKEENPTPIYVVVVFDKSGSMNCAQYSYNDWGEKYCSSVGTKWTDAVSGTKSFANTLHTQLNTGDTKYAYMALVQFSGDDSYWFDQPYDDASVVRGFAANDFSSVNFGSADGGTNIGEGLRQANLLFDNTTIPEDALKYVVLIGDGQPTFYSDDDGYTDGDGSVMDTGSYNYAVNQATALKEDGVEIFTIGYNISDDTTAQSVLQTIASDDVEGSDIQHFVSADSATIATTFTNIANGITYKKAGTNATLTDNIGSNFKIVGKDGSIYTSEVISEITETGTTISFEVELDQSKVTSDGWYDTNAGFNLTYTDANGDEQIISTDEDPQVWWTPTVYNYTVNYYKDSFDTVVIASENRKVINGTVINDSNVEKDKYLNNSTLGTVGYEFNTINPDSITIDSNGKTINVLYTIKKFSYTVEFYYDGVLESESTITESNINYGTVVDSTTYYDDGSREGYSLDTNNSTSGNITIDNNDKVIKVYYKKNSYGYTVNYHFNNVVDTDFTKNDNALFGDTINAEDNYLEDTDLVSKETEDNTDYFINPSYPSNPNEIVIGTDSSENVINIYYVSTVVTNEDMIKTSNTDKITSSDTGITYTVNYTSVVNNIKNGDKVKVVITDTLPNEIDESKSTLNGGIYDSETNTITWTFEEVMTKFTEEYDASKTITYTVVYKNIGNGDGSDLTNNVIGQTTAGGKTTIGEGDSSTVKVEIPAEVIVHHYVKGTTNKVANDENLTGQVGESYTTNYKTDILGYTVDMESIPSNANGTYTETTIEVTYYYTKNDGIIENTDVIKTSTDLDKVIDSVNSVFGYTIDAYAEVKDYVGDVTLKVVDTLPYEIDTEKSNIGSCTYDSENKTITCIEEYTIDEEDYTTNSKGEKVFVIDETFTLDLVFVGVDSETVTNNAKVEIILDDSNITEKDEESEDVMVEKGKVTATYEDTNGNTLHNDVTTEGLVGNSYTTEEKTFFGYTLTETPENKDGIYTKEDIIVQYIYTKDNGTIEKTDVVKTATDTDKVIDSVNGTFGYTIDAYAEVKDYVGDVTLKVVDTLPYEIDIEKSNIGSCTYDSENKTITCTKEYTIDEEDYITNSEGEKVFVIDETFTLDLVFVGVDSETVTNNAKVEIILDDSNVTEEDEATEEVTVAKGMVVATYKDTNGNTLHADVTTTELAGTEYLTEIKEFYGYSLVKVPENKNGTFLANQTITVNYVYSKNDGKIENPKVEKIGPDSVDSIDKEFNYIFKYSATINEYTGKVTLKLVDTLPFKAIITSKDNACQYNEESLTIVCEKEYNITGSTTINEEFKVSLKYIDIEFEDINTSTTLTNSVIAELIYGDNKVTKSDEKDTIVNTGSVVVTYKDTNGNTLHEDVTTTDLAGTSYTTEEKTFFGYTLTKDPENKEGKYVANSTITVNYVYSKNDGTIENTGVVKTSTDLDKVIDSVNGTFGYTIDAYAEVKDYIGDVTLKVVDTLPYEIDTEKSNIGSCTYDNGNKTIICTKEYTIDEEDYITNNEDEKVFVIDETFTLDLVFVGVDSEIVTNNAKVEIILDDSNVIEEDKEPEDVTVAKGMVVATYKDTDGNTLHEDVTTTDLAGIEYLTETKEFYGYTLTEEPKNKEGQYVANETITVNYIYSKNIGTSEEVLVKYGEKEIEDIDSEFKYTITYNTTIKDYIGEAILVIIDELPYEIDIEKSIYNKENCEYVEGKLVCTYKKNITKEDNEFNIEENFTLYYVNITESNVTNKVVSKLIYGTTTKENDSEYTSEVKEGTVIINYVNKNGDKLTESITLTGLVGNSYITTKKIFDKYNFIEVKGEVEGEYIDGIIEVTYVYDLTPLPPQTGVEFNPFMFVKYLVFAAIIIVSGKTYKLIKSN